MGDLGKRDKGKAKVKKDTELSAGSDFSNSIVHNSFCFIDMRENQVQSV